MTETSASLRVDKDTPTLRELTTRKLRQAILDLRLKPGEHLVERVLCEETGVSRSCLREALRHLESEGLVERIGGRGLVVSSVTPDEARQIYEVRAALESEIGRLFAERAEPESIEELFAALERIEASIEAKDVSEYVQSLDAFYAVLCEGSANAVAKRILTTLHARITYLRTVTTAKASETRERETLSLLREIAVEARNRSPDKVARRCRAFVERSAAFALKILTETTGSEKNRG